MINGSICKGMARNRLKSKMAGLYMFSEIRVRDMLVKQGKLAFSLTLVSTEVCAVANSEYTTFEQDNYLKKEHK
ncbi:hypothetical protein [Amphibacillus cookii]|uniref:hypothetical protein n=1 Tax=Amphibacillus cookii TaxID=767787 RepID=UPI00195A1965|nr:hypothetical protein [Amphibacillus cookii]MBM7543006.1 hypothetical protein [Amphibacillus cookii]